MKERCICLLLTIIFIILMVPVVKHEIVDKHKTVAALEGIKVQANNAGDISARKTVENSEINVVYTKKTDKFILYRDGIKYDLKVTNVGKDIVVDLTDDNVKFENKDKVTGQFVMAIPIIYMTPAIIASVEAVIGTVAVASGACITWYTVKSLEKTITISETKPKPLPVYYAAALINGQTVISNPITYTQAVYRLTQGMDVFATNHNAAYSATLAAATNNMRVYSHPPHGGEGYYPHYHPEGRKWIQSRDHMPHCWYIPTP